MLIYSYISRKIWSSPWYICSIGNKGFICIASLRWECSGNSNCKINVWFLGYIICKRCNNSRCDNGSGLYVPWVYCVYWYGIRWIWILDIVRLIICECKVSISNGNWISVIEYCTSPRLYGESSCFFYEETLWQWIGKHVEYFRNIIYCNSLCWCMEFCSCSSESSILCSNRNSGSDNGMKIYYLTKSAIIRRNH